MNGLKLVAAFLAGAGCGVLGTKKYFETKYDKLFEEELESLKESRIGLGHIEEKNSIVDEEFVQEVEKELENPDSIFHSSIDNMFEQAEVDHKEQVDYMHVLEKKEHPVKEEISEPYEITEEEYSETELGFEKLCLHYYTDDDSLVYHDTGEAPETLTIGDENLNKVRLSDETDFYFRNYEFGEDYEVIKIKGSYYIQIGE